MATDKHNIKDKFRPEESLPEGFGWEDMERGISDKMKSKNTNSFSFDKRYPILLALLLIGSVTFYFLNKSKSTVDKNVLQSKVEVENFANTSNSLSSTFNNKETKKQETRRQDSKIQQDTREQEVKNQVAREQEARSQESRLQDNKRKEETRSLETRKQNSKNQVSGAQILGLSNTKSNNQINDDGVRALIDSTSPKENQQEGSKKINNNSDVKVRDVIAQRVEKKDLKPNENISFLAKIEDKEKEINTLSYGGNEMEVNRIASSLNNDSNSDNNNQLNERGEIKSISLLSLVNQKGLISQSKNNFNKENKISFIQSQIKRKNSSENRNMIYLIGGANQHFSLYGKDSIGEIKNQYERSGQAMSIGIGIERKLSKKLSLDAAFNYHEIKSVLDYNNVESRYQKVKQNVLISQTINAITSDTTKIYGTALVSGKKIRTVLHHNTETAIHIPIVFRYNWQRQKLAIGLGLGPSIHYALSNGGRTVEAFDQFKPIDNNYLARWYVTGIGQLKLGYDVTNKISVGTKISTTLPLSNINKEVGTSLRRSMVIGQIYAGYRF